MAQAPTLYDFEIALSHVDRSLDAKLNLRVARHPSETFARVWLRVLAACLFHEERLVSGKGLSDPDQPDLEVRDLTGDLTLWIRVGKAEPRTLQKVVDQNGRARVAVLFESPQRLEAFLGEARDGKLHRLARAELRAVDPELLSALAAKEDRRSKASVTIVGDHFYVERAGESVDGPLTHGAL